MGRRWNFALLDNSRRALIQWCCIQGAVDISRLLTNKAVLYSTLHYCSICEKSSSQLVPEVECLFELFML